MKNKNILQGVVKGIRTFVYLRLRVFLVGNIEPSMEWILVKIQE